jgi:phosphatidylglycerol---prolipoprotein diacylglyceryl transferase
MHPVMFSIGNMAFPSYYIMISLGIVAGMLVAPLFYKQSKIETSVMLDIGIIISLTWIIGARFFHIVFEMPGYYFVHPLEMFKFWNGGYVFYGGYIFPVLIIYYYSKIKKLPFLKISDTVLPCLAIGIAIGRLGCLMQGCCYGAEVHSHIPWAVVFSAGTPGDTPKGIPLHPTQIYMSLNGLLIFLILLWRFGRRKFDGEITYLFFILYATGLSIIEFFRGDYRGNLFEPYLSTSQLISLLLGTLCLFLLIKGYRKVKTRD